MGLRCSVLGHRYGDRERVEERDERGDEVISAVREVKTCERCGDELVVTESKEVTAKERPPIEEPEPSSSEPSTHDPPEPKPFEPESTDPDADDGIILSDEPADDRGDWPADPVPDDEAETDQTPEEDTGAELWPEVPEDEDEGFDAMVGDVDEEIADRIIEAVQSEPADPSGEDTEGGFYRAKPMNDPSDPSDTDVHTEYYCPRCDWSAESLVTSVRRGDICPACRRGYVAEREDD